VRHPRLCPVTGAMATSGGVWNSEDRAAAERSAQRTPDESPPPEHVADLIAWIAAAPAGPALPQVTITPLHERGWL